MVSARSLRIGPRLSVARTGTPAAGSKRRVMPDAGDAVGNRLNWLPTAEKMGAKGVTPVGDPNRPFWLGRQYRLLECVRQLDVCAVAGGHGTRQANNKDDSRSLR